MSFLPRHYQTAFQLFQVSLPNTHNTFAVMSNIHSEITQDLLDTEVDGFNSFDLDNRLLRAIAKLGYSHPTLVQAKAVPLALQGKDILARARTGSGKTAAYCMPIVQKILLAKEVSCLTVFPLVSLC